MKYSVSGYERTSATYASWFSTPHSFPVLHITVFLLILSSYIFLPFLVELTFYNILLHVQFKEPFPTDERVLAT